MTTSADSRELDNVQLDAEARKSKEAHEVIQQLLDEPYGDDMPALGDCRVAVVHDWLDKVGGAERVLHEILRCFPTADLYAVVDLLSDEDRDIIFRRPVYTTFVQRLPGMKKHFRSYLPLMPLAIEQLDLSKYDVVISSSWAVAKGVITGADQLHVAYVHTPIRYAWEQQYQYFRDARMDRGLKGGLARLAMHWMRLWDVRTAFGVDVWVANSANVARRISKTYGQRAHVLYPPVAVDRFPFSRDKQDFYITCSRLVPYKRVDIIIKAFAAMRERALVVVGDGPELSRLKQLAGDARHITFVGRQSDSELGDLMKRARAFVFAAAEDFGIAPLEAQACGTPVIAYGKGGALETIKGVGSDSPTGCFYRQQTPEALRDAIDRFECLPNSIDAWDCRMNANRFRPEAFREGLLKIVNDHWGDVVLRPEPLGRPAQRPSRTRAKHGEESLKLATARRPRPVSESTL